jgi:4-hydroxybenzoate polyprenyltransferase
MRGYLREMFPLPGHLALALAAGAGTAAFVRSVQGGAGPVTAAAVASPTWNIFATLLILRLMDELKDRDIDRRLFPTRPLPSGRVRESDIRRSLAAAIILYLGANAHAAPVFLSAAIVLAYSGLMYRRFFTPALLERSLPITLATHTPSAPLMLLQAHVAAADRLGIPPGELRWSAVLPAVGMAWFALLGWELARKIRAPAEETAYVTYSRLLGPTGAVAAAATAQGLAVALGVHLAVRFRLPPWHPAALVGAWLMCATAYARFLRRPDPSTSRLKPYAAAFVFAVLLAHLGAFGPGR